MLKINFFSNQYFPLSFAFANELNKIFLTPTLYIHQYFLLSSMLIVSFVYIALIHLKLNFFDVCEVGESNFPLFNGQTNGSVSVI